LCETLSIIGRSEKIGSRMFRKDVNVLDDFAAAIRLLTSRAPQRARGRRARYLPEKRIHPGERRYLLLIVSYKSSPGVPVDQQGLVSKVFPASVRGHIVLRNHIPDSLPIHQYRSRPDSLRRYDPARQKRPQTHDLLLNPELGRKAYPEGLSFSMRKAQSFASPQRSYHFRQSSLYSLLSETAADESMSTHLRGFAVAGCTHRTHAKSE